MSSISVRQSRSTSRSFGPVLLRLENRRLPLPRQILEATGLEQRLVELPTLRFA
jgi:hypothetical protein